MRKPPLTIQSDTPLIRLDHVTRLYGKVIGVNDLHVELPQGAYGLVGPNGAGKSTLIGLITGAIRPSIGTVEVFGCNPKQDTRVQHHIGLCPATDILLPGVTPRHWLNQLMGLSGWPPKAASKRTTELLEYVGLGKEIDRPMNTFSLGMRQRCKLAQAMADDPQFLILDEPFNGLDPIGRAEMTAMLKQWTQRGKSLLLASHVLHEVEQVTDSFLLIYGGRLLASGTAGELRQLLFELPQELTLLTPQPEQLASWLARYDWLESIRMDASRKRITVAVRHPTEFFHAIAEAVHSGIVVEQLLGAEGDMSTLFRILIAHHRGTRIKYQLPF